MTNAHTHTNNLKTIKISMLTCRKKNVHMHLDRSFKRKYSSF